MPKVISNWREWLSRYGWAEIWGTIGSYAGYILGFASSESAILSAFAAAMGENAGYYGCILWREFARHRRDGHRLTPGLSMTVLHDLVREFGIAEVLDTLIVRPSATYFSVAIFGARFGVLVGKISADLVFYSLTITFYERLKAKRQDM